MFVIWLYGTFRLMPPKIRAEYLKHDSRPRLRDIKAMTAAAVALTPFLYALGVLLFFTVKPAGKEKET